MVTFVAGQATGLGIALAIAWVERRWRRQEVRAAERSARLEERFEPVRRYGLALQGFVRGAARWMRVWEHGRSVHGSAQDVRKLLEGQWAEVVKVTPRPEPVSLVEDAAAREYLVKLQLVVWRCHDRCVECLEAGELMAEDEALGYVAETDEKLARMLGRMDEVLEEVDR